MIDDPKSDWAAYEPVYDSKNGIKKKTFVPMLILNMSR